MKYQIVKYSQSGSVRGHVSQVFTGGQTAFGRKSDALRAATEMNRRNNVNVDQDEDIYAAQNTATGEII